MITVDTVVIDKTTQNRIIGKARYALPDI